MKTKLIAPKSAPLHCLGLLALSVTLAAQFLHAGDTVVSSPAIARASDTLASSNGYYVEVFGGFSGLMNEGLSLDGSNYDADYGRGFLTGAAVGHQWSGFSLELEFFYRSNDVDQVSRGAERFMDGDYASTNFFLNAQHTFGSIAGNSAVIRPYVGAGLGLMQEIDIDLPGVGVEDISANWEFGFQALAGIRWEISEHWSLFAEARYIYGGDPELRAETGGGQTVRADYNGWSALAGLRWTF
jgi:opacity protein-like surface antigen